MLSAQRLAILVDSENLEIPAKKYGSEGRTRSRTRVYPNWKVIVSEITQGRALVRNIYYKQKGQPISSRFRTFWVEQLHGEIQQVTKSADPYLIVDAISLVEKVDVIAILAGDKDYLPLIAYLKARGCKVEFASFAGAAARSIKAAADHFHSLSKKHTIALQSSQSRRAN